MKLTITKTALTDVTGHAANGVPAGVEANRPALSGMRLEASAGQVTAWATDYDGMFRWTAPADVGEPGAVLPPAGVLRQVLANLPSGQIQVETSGDGTLVLASGTAVYSMPLLDAGEYPSLPVLPDPAVTFEAAALVQAIERAAFAANARHAEPHLSVVRLEPDMEAGTLTLVATDAFRISVAPVQWLSAAGQVPEAYIRADLLQRWVRALSGSGDRPVTLGFAASGGAASVAALRDGAREATARCVSLEKYVDWRRGTRAPAGEHLAAEVDAAGLAAVVHKLASVMAPKLPLWLTFSGGEVKVATSRAEGRATGADVFPAAWEGPRFQIGFEPGRLEEGLAAMGGRTRIVMTTPSKPAFMMRVPGTGEGEMPFGEQEYRHVLMPFARSAAQPAE
jgi:DNA polymerase III subunit beta